MWYYCMLQLNKYSFLMCSMTHITSRGDIILLHFDLPFPHLKRYETLVYLVYEGNLCFEDPPVKEKLCESLKKV